MRIIGVVAFLLLAFAAGVSLGAIAKFGLGYDIETTAPDSSEYNPE